MSDNPYGPKPPPDRKPDPAQATRILSSRCMGYQTDDDGLITRAVWSGIVKFDGEQGGCGEMRYWTDSGAYLEEPPRIDKAVASWPCGVAE